MAKQMVFDDEARKPLLEGVSKLARAVRSTLGPRGCNAILDKGWGSPKITKDGVTVAEDLVPSPLSTGLTVTATAHSPVKCTD